MVVERRLSSVEAAEEPVPEASFGICNANVVEIGIREHALHNFAGFRDNLDSTLATLTSVGWSAAYLAFEGADILRSGRSQLEPVGCGALLTCFGGEAGAWRLIDRAQEERRVPLED